MMILLIPVLAVLAIAASPLMPNPRPRTPDPADPLDRSEAANYLRLGVSTLDRGVWSGKIPHYRLPNGRAMFSRDDLRSLVASGYRPASQD